MFKEFLSLFNPANLPIINKTFWRGFLYTLISCFIFVLLAVGSILFELQKGFGTISPTELVSRVAESATSEYPEDLVLNLSKDGELSKNIPGPIFFDFGMSSDLQGDIANHFAVIDDSLSASIDNLSKVDAQILIGKDGFIGKDANGKIQGYSFFDIINQNKKNNTDFEGLSLDKTKLLALKNEAVPIVGNLILIGATILLLIMPFVFATVHIVWTILVAVISMLMFALAKGSRNFEESYLIALYASAPVIILSLLVERFTNIPLIQTIFTIAWIVLGYFLFNKKNN